MCQELVTTLITVPVRRMGFVVVSPEFVDEVNILHRTIVYPPEFARLESVYCRSLF